MELAVLMIRAVVFFLAVLSFADVVHLLVKAMLPFAHGGSGGKLRLRLKNSDTAEMQLRGLLAEIRWGGFGGSVLVIAPDRESFDIAGKIIGNYPNIGLLYQGDLNYNIK